MQHKKKIQKFSITNKVNSNFVNSFLYHSIGKLFCSESLNLGLNEMKRVAHKIIIVDYAVPLPKNYTGIGSRVAEFLAGKEHNQNFKSYYKLGGLPEILKSNNLKIEKSKLMEKGAFQMVVC